MKKITLILVAISLIISSFSNLNVEAKSKLLRKNEDKYDVKVVKQNSFYQKIKFTNLENGEIEYLESFLLENGDYKYKSTDSNQIELAIQNLADEVVVTDELDNEIITIEIDETHDSINTLNIKRIEDGISTFGLYDNVPKKTKWASYRKYKSSKDANVNAVSLLAGILVSIAGGGPVVGIVTAAATYYYSSKSKRIYYHIDKQTRFNNGRQVRSIVKYYKYHDYTGYLGVYTGKTRNVCFTCLP